MAEKEKIEKAKNGDMEAFGKVFDNLSPRILKFFQMRADDEIARDLLHDTFVEVWESLDNYEPRENAKFSTWVFAIARNLLADYYRQGKQTASADDLPLSRDSKLTEEVMASEVKAAIKDLPEKQQDALTLSLIEGYEYSEVAEIMGITENYTRQLVFRAKEALNKEFYGE